MIRLLLLVFIIFIGLLIGPSLVGNDSYVLIAINGWTLETSLVVMSMVIIVFYALLQLAEWALINTLAMWGRTRHWFGWRKERIAQKKTLDGVLAFAAGHFSQAEQLSVNHVKHSKQPLLNYFTAINAAQTQGKLEQRDEYLTQALAHDSENPALLATKLRFMIQAQEFKAADSWLAAQPKLIKNHDDILPLHYTVTRHLSLHDAALSINDLMFKRKLISAFEHDANARTNYIGLLSSTEKSDFEQVKTAYKAIPRKYRNHIDIFCEYAKLSINYTHSDLIEKELFQRLVKQYDEKLLAVLHQCDTKNAVSWTKKLENIDQLHGDVAFIDVLIHLYQLDRQWKLAKEWTLKAVEVAPSAKRFETLAQIQQELGESGGALESFNKALKFRQVK